MDLFHLITDAESAEVRRFLVAAKLTDRVNFRNVFYESHAKALEAATGAPDVPCLVVDGQLVLRGKAKIVAWLSTHATMA